MLRHIPSRHRSQEMLLSARLRDGQSWNSQVLYPLKFGELRVRNGWKMKDLESNLELPQGY